MKNHQCGWCPDFGGFTKLGLKSRSLYIPKNPNRGWFICPDCRVKKKVSALKKENTRLAAGEYFLNIF
jgi:hypothetical protein